LTELISIGDELYRFLTLPTTSRSRHRVTKRGRHEAARTAEVAYRLYDSLYTTRMINVANLGEFIKNAGLPSGEVSRIRQYERFIGEAIENLRMIKSYRTPQTLRSFARLFTTLLPPFFAPTFAELAINVGSMAIGITFAVITALCLNALLEGVEILEDPFVAFVTLDGIDVREEFEVLHWQQLVNARNYVFPKANPYGQASFVLAGDLADLEMGNQDQIDSHFPLGNISEKTTTAPKRGLTRMRRSSNGAHRKMFSWGDNNLLANVECDVDPSAGSMDFWRKSAYQMYGRDKSESFHSAATQRATPSFDKTDRTDI